MFTDLYMYFLTYFNNWHADNKPLCMDLDRLTKSNLQKGGSSIKQYIDALLNTSVL